MIKLAKLVIVMALVLVSVNVAEARTLMYGLSGSDVSALQTWLINGGYPIPLIEDGIAKKGFFGEQTANAVKMYQEDKGLPLTGSIDSLSYSSNRASPVLGAVSGPDLYSPYFNINGVTRFYNRMKLAQATSTICSIKAPSATSTLVNGSIQFTTLASSTAVTVDVAIGTNYSGTTTNIISGFPVAANTQTYIVFASTTAGTVFSPNNYLIGRFNTSQHLNGVGNVPVGYCQATFEVL